MKIPLLESSIAEHSIPRHYGMAGNVGWLAIPDSGSLTKISDILSGQGLTAVVIRGRNGRHTFGRIHSHTIQGTVKQALDPLGKFPEFQ